MKTSDRITTLRTFAAAYLAYLGFRLLGATEKHAWERAKVAIVKAVIDKVVEMTGVTHPDGTPAGQMQITFDGGPAHKEVRNVEICEFIALQSGGRTFTYKRTDRMRGASIVFTLLDPSRGPA